jgi:hypothetical protein
MRLNVRLLVHSDKFSYPDGREGGMVIRAEEVTSEVISTRFLKSSPLKWNRI